LIIIIQETETKDWVEKTIKFIYWNGGVDDLVAVIIDSNTYYYHKYQLGSIVWISDSSWSLISKYEYDVFWKASLVEWIDIWNIYLENEKGMKKEKFWVI